MMKQFIPLIVIFLFSTVQGSLSQVPKVYSNISEDEKGVYLQTEDGRKIRPYPPSPTYTLGDMEKGIEGTKNGISFSFDRIDKGTLYYGFIPDEGDFQFPVFFKKEASIEQGKASLNIMDNLSGKYDMINWSEKRQGSIGYRVLNEKGKMIYEGRVNFTGGGPFEIAPTIIDGPTINCLTSHSAKIAFRTREPRTLQIMIRPKDLHEKKGRRIDVIGEKKARVQHEIHTEKLEPATEYYYKVSLGNGMKKQGTFKTPPAKGTRTSFTFAYASDSRAGQGGGERNMYGANFYIMRKIGAAVEQKDAAFMQFTGDLIDGYLGSKEEIKLQYMNWKRAVEPFWRNFPIYTTMGNHEALMYYFVDTVEQKGYAIDKFPFGSQSSESVFREMFVNPENGPYSEDGAAYDPRKNEKDFPSYKESVYSYVHDNVAMIVLNSDYWYAPSLARSTYTSGNLHGYIMDRQLAWLEKELRTYERDKEIDHIFLTLHTPFFPNGGHSSDDMWYKGHDRFRPYVNGEPVEQGIIERRDELLDLLANESEKFVAILTGDEHNYNKLRITPEMPKYPEDWDKEKLRLDRKIWQINNGSAGAPYYAQEDLPWSDNVSSFSTKNVVLFFHVDGKKVWMEAVDPRTFEVVDKITLKGGGKDE